ncbi:MAG: formylglycine-generating enzyme family protein [Lewinellaceae bacterium]|nr:formylglycine-generating enzyme family protein [Lewinellaceae bacterium]
MPGIRLPETRVPTCSPTLCACKAPHLTLSEGIINADEGGKHRIQDLPPTLFDGNPESVPRPAMIAIPAGAFDMGDVFGEGISDEKPVHRVTLGAYEIGAYEVTFEAYDLFCDWTQREKPPDNGWGRGKRPVLNITWYDAIDYCNWLSEQLGYKPVYTRKGDDVLSDWRANGYRLPTEAEWEYAAREGGKKVRFGNGKDIADPKVINFDGSAIYKTAYSIAGEYREKTVPVGSLGSPNALGLHDMSGNVWEWCWDWYDDYTVAAQQNPKGLQSGGSRVHRGGSWSNDARYCRVACRYGYTPSLRYHLGFRLCRAF